MPVVINEFETVPPPPSGGTRSGSNSDGGAGGQGQPKPPEPRELEPVLRQIQARLMRVWAH